MPRTRAGRDREGERNRVGATRWRRFVDALQSNQNFEYLYWLQVSDLNWPVHPPSSLAPWSSYDSGLVLLSQRKPEFSTDDRIAYTLTTHTALSSSVAASRVPSQKCRSKLVGVFTPHSFRAFSQHRLCFIYHE